MTDSLLHIGSIYADIAGDSRYATTVDVVRDAEGAYHVRRSERVANDGMDGDGRAGPYALKQEIVLNHPARPADLVRAIKRAFDETIDRYGKPMKRWRWRTNECGLSAAKAKRAMEGGPG